jgi:preprotein translocase SecE subunit
MAIVRTTNPNDDSKDDAARRRRDDVAAGASGNGAGDNPRARATAKPGARLERARSAANRSTLATQGSSPAEFLRDTRAELKRVVWPTKEVVTSGTIVTIGMLVFFAVYIFALNLISESLLGALGFLSDIKP